MHCWLLLSSPTNAQLDPPSAVHGHLHLQFHCAYEEKQQIFGVLDGTPRVAAENSYKTIRRDVHNNVNGNVNS
jgi:hypothetical protein